MKTDTKILIFVVVAAIIIAFTIYIYNKQRQKKVSPTPIKQQFGLSKFKDLFPNCSESCWESCWNGQNYDLSCLNKCCFIS